jgi:uncharacterized delta-60 repeat protein
MRDAKRTGALHHSPLRLCILVITGCGGGHEHPPPGTDASALDAMGIVDTSPLDGAAMCTASSILDPGFGSSGFAPPLFGLSHGSAGATALVVDSSLKIVTAGYEPTRDNEVITSFTVYRLMPDGGLDVSFGAGGRQKHCPAPGRFCWWNDVALQPDGKLVAAGGFDDDTEGHVAIARYNTDGSLDTTFGASGTLIDHALPQGQAVGVAVDTQGRVVVAAHCADGVGPNDESYFTTVRYLSNGDRDSSFGTGGVAEAAWRGGQHAPRDLALQSDGRIVVVGMVKPFGNGASTLGVVRYNVDGTRDQTFGAQGLATHSLGGDTVGTGIALDTQNRLLVSASFPGGGALVRFAADGSLDASFGSNGAAVSSQSASVYEKPFVLPDGRLLAVGNISFSPTDVRLALARYESTGSPDATFGVAGTGIVGSPLASVHFGNAVGLQGNDRPVIAGTQMASPTNSDFVVARFCP